MNQEERLILLRALSAYAVSLHTEQDSENLAGVLKLIHELTHSV